MGRRGRQANASEEIHRLTTQSRIQYWKLLPCQLQVLSYRFLHLLLGQLLLGSLCCCRWIEQSFSCLSQVSRQLPVFISPRSLALCFLEKVDLTETSEFFVIGGLIGMLTSPFTCTSPRASMKSFVVPKASPIALIRTRYSLIGNKTRRVFCWCPEVSCILRARCHLTGLLGRHQQF